MAGATEAADIEMAQERMGQDLESAATPPPMVSMEVSIGNGLRPSPFTPPILLPPEDEWDDLDPANKSSWVAKEVFPSPAVQAVAQVKKARVQPSVIVQEGGKKCFKRSRVPPPRIWDPLWGEAPPSREPLWDLVYSCCPCAGVGCSGNGRRLWRRFFLSWSFLLVLVQLAVLGVALLHGGIAPFWHNPTFGPDSSTLDAMGAKNAAKILLNNEWWRIPTSLLLHSGALHFLCNASIQLRSGASLEAMWGSTAWIVIYGGSGCFGMLCSCIWRAGALGVGSSGGICGLHSAWAVFIMCTWNQTSPVDEVLRNLTVVSLVVNIVAMGAMSFLPFIDFAGHLGGLAMGAALATAIFAGRLQSAVWKYALRALGILLVLGLSSGATAWFLLFTQPDPAFLEL